MRLFRKARETEKKPEPKGEFYDEIILHCSTEGCTNKGKDVFVDVNLLDDEVLLYVNAYRDPICEHMWKQAKEDFDYEIEEVKEEAQLKWCPHCIKRIPKSSTVCPECGADLVQQKARSD